MCIRDRYNLVNIELDAPQTSYDSISNILMTAEHQSTLENVYSVGTGDIDVYKRQGLKRGKDYKLNNKVITINILMYNICLLYTSHDGTPVSTNIQAKYRNY